MDEITFEKSGEVKMKVELIVFYVFFLLLNFIYGYKRNRLLWKFRNQLVSTDYYRIKTRRAHVFAFLLIFILISIVVLNKNNPDYITYQWMYESGMKVEKGWKFLEDVAKNFGLDYDSFKSVVVMVSFILIEVGLIKLHVNENIVLSMYAVYPFAMDAIQLRNLLATSIFVYAYHFLINDTKRGKYIYAFLVIISATIHSLFPIFLLLLLINHKFPNSARNKLISIAVIFSILSVCLLKLFPNFVAIFGNYLFSTKADKINYYVQNNVGFGFLIFGIMQTLFITSIYFFMKNTEGFNDYEIKLIKSIYWSDMLLLCTLPLFTIHIEFYRIFRNMCIFNFIVFSFILRRKKDKNFYIGLLCCIIAFFMYIWMDYFNYPGRFEYVFATFFK